MSRVIQTEIHFNNANRSVKFKVVSEAKRLSKRSVENMKQLTINMSFPLANLNFLAKTQSELLRYLRRSLSIFVEKNLLSLSADFDESVAKRQSK